MPRYFEIEELRRAGSRKLWAAIGVLSSTTVLSLLVTLALVVKPSPVIAFDATGRPIIFTDTYTPALEMTRVRAEWFTRFFLSKYITIDSTRLDEDLTGALNLMTPDLRDIVMLDGKEIERRTKYQGANVRSSLPDFDLRIGEFEPQGKDPIYVYGWGRHVFEPIFGGTEQDKAQRFLFVKMQLDRYPVAKNIPHGLLVHYIDWKSFDSEADLNVELLKLQRDAGGGKRK